jgi:hypothetical protein
MNDKIALDIISRIKEDMGEGLLETMIYMDNNLEQFSHEEQQAFRVAYNGFRKLFEPRGGWPDESLDVDCV